MPSSRVLASASSCCSKQRTRNCRAIGGVVFGLIIGSLSLVIRDNNPGDTARTQAMGQVSAFLYDRHVPKPTIRHIRAFYREYFVDRSVIKEAKIFSCLPERQKHEVGGHRRLRFFACPLRLDSGVSTICLC